MLLLPLQELSGIIHADIRHKQLECILQILHSNGDTLNQGWPLVLGVIGAISNEQGENLIRLAFQSLQLVVTDFLPTMPCSCLQVCVDVAGRFGLQTRELNISLTAIGLLWNISDYFSQNHERIVGELAGEPGGGSEGELTLPPYDALWMSVFLRLGELCVDQRPAVRKSAGQTLFSTITTHGALLQPHTWQTVLWKVLFPLLDNVKKLSAIASGRRDDTNEENILMHHSRDTAQKQWAETQVLTLAGVARVFYSHRTELQQLGDFPRAWVLLLEYIEVAALCKNGEVSLAALKSFQEILHPNGVTTPDTPHGDPTKGPLPKLDPVPRMAGDHSIPKDLGKVTKICAGDPDEEAALWSTAWRVWLSIGTAATTPPAPTEDKSQLYIPSQAFLTSLVMIFPALYQHIKHRFVVADLLKLSSVLQRALTVPVHSDSSPFIIPIGEVTLTALQSAILAAIKEVMLGSENIQVMYPEVFHQLLTYVEYTVKPPKFGKVEAKSVSAVKGTQADWVAMNYVPFAEAIVGMVTELYRATAKHPSVIHGHVLQNIVKVRLLFHYADYIFVTS
ncbi:hypothetical protein NP493_305g02026 [Ridgeia piscesae]|uniref:Protein MON2 homolog n=1 Tax=Ridgeia piscesae TaxID=27915 RepID=A0AAD9NV65_RIDPI|nr:hypothetical protein NP493_305g02026 [Ridgeia piscesae]